MMCTVLCRLQRVYVARIEGLEGDLSIQRRCSYCSTVWSHLTQLSCQACGAASMIQYRPLRIIICDSQFLCELPVLVPPHLVAELCGVPADHLTHTTEAVMWQQMALTGIKLVSSSAQRREPFDMDVFVSIQVDENGMVRTRSAALRSVHPCYF